MSEKPSIGQEWAARFADLLVDEEAPEASGADGTAVVERPLEVLTPAEMNQADQLTIAGGTPGAQLMERAGAAVAAVVRRHLPEGARVAILTGPGNNGGDGFVAARVLAETGYKVTVAMLTARERLSGDAAFAAANWTGASRGLSPTIVDGTDLVVDAIFGAGLDRPIAAAVAKVIDAVNASGVPVVAIDLPSGVNGRSGAVMGTAIRARETVTFFRMKPAHLMLPGRPLCGHVTVADIGIDAASLEVIRPATFRNLPGFWSLPPLAVDGHKYDRGHAVVVSGGPSRTGAARLAARGALRAGAGLVTVASPADAVAVNAAHLTAIMLLPMEGAAGLSAILADERKNAVVLGPGLGVGEPTADLVTAALGSNASAVLDADALTSFAPAPDRLFAMVGSRGKPVVLTPHEGEFRALFPGVDAGDSRLDRARQAAVLTGAIVVLKGPDTVVAGPDGRATIADNAPPTLATAGSGDVLAGVVGGLLAQSMPPLEAASAAVWLHGAAAATMGRGLIAEDLPEALPAAFARLHA